MFPRYLPVHPQPPQSWTQVHNPQYPPTSEVSYVYFLLLLTTDHIASTLAAAEAHQDPGPSAPTDSEEQDNEVVTLRGKYCVFSCCACCTL